MKNKDCKMNLCKILFLSFAGLFFSVSAYSKSFDFDKYGTLKISIPDNWFINSKPVRIPKDELVSYKFVIKPRNKANAELLITFIFIGNQTPDVKKIEAELKQNCKQFVSKSVEKKINIKHFSLKTGCGAYCTLTDASLIGKKTNPGEYKIMGSGEVQITSNVFGTVSIMANNAKSKEFKEMIQIINSLKIKQ
jgi:hypothetical protein